MAVELLARSSSRHTPHRRVLKGRRALRRQELREVAASPRSGRSKPRPSSSRQRPSSRWRSYALEISAPSAKRADPLSAARGRIAAAAAPTPTPGKMQGGGSSAAIMAAARRKKARSPHDDDDGGGERCQNESAHAGTQLQRMPVWLHLCCSPLFTPVHSSALLCTDRVARF